MTIKKKTSAHGGLLGKINTLDHQICCVKNQLNELRKLIMTECKNPDICQDKIDADKAAQEATQEICLETLLDIKPKGEA